MAKDTQLSTITVNAQADALARLLDNGYRRIYSGAKPAAADTALSGNTQLAELRFGNPSAPPAVDGVLAFNLLPDVSADALGNATFYRDFKSDGVTAIKDGTIGGLGSNSNLELNIVLIETGVQVSLASDNHIVSKSTPGY